MVEVSVDNFMYWLTGSWLSHWWSPFLFIGIGIYIYFRITGKFVPFWSKKTTENGQPENINYGLVLNDNSNNPNISIKQKIESWLRKILGR